MPAGEVVRGVLLPGDQLLRVEQLTVGTSADLVHHRRLQVDEDASRHVLAGTRLGEEGVEGVTTATDPKLAQYVVITTVVSLQKKFMFSEAPIL